jgi:hypothetical protein
VGDEPTQEWVIQFRGGPWEGQSTLVQHQPDQVIDPPIRYRLKVKIG